MFVVDVGIIDLYLVFRNLLVDSFDLDGALVDLEIGKSI